MDNDRVRYYSRCTKNILGHSSGTKVKKSITTDENCSYLFHKTLLFNDAVPRLYPSFYCPNPSHEFYWNKHLLRTSTMLLVYMIRHKCPISKNCTTLFNLLIPVLRRKKNNGYNFLQRSNSFATILNRE